MNFGSLLSYTQNLQYGVGALAIDLWTGTARYPPCGKSVQMFLLSQTQKFMLIWLPIGGKALQLATLHVVVVNLLTCSFVHKSDALGIKLLIGALGSGNARCLTFIDMSCLSPTQYLYNSCQNLAADWWTCMTCTTRCHFEVNRLTCSCVPNSRTCM